MDRLRVVGKQSLKGTIKISGAKNAALPLMAACLLTDGRLDLSNVPHLADIQSMVQLLSQHGVDIAAYFDRGHLSLCASAISNITAPYDLVRKMRASILVLGPLVARHGEAKISLPGGCAIGTRPVDLHINGLKAMGAEINIDQGYIHAIAPKGLTGAKITFPLISVTGTENLMMAATLAKGETTLINAAREPEVVDLADCLNKMGAKITGAGTDVITIQGVDHLHGAEHAVVADRIEAGTYMIAGVITRGQVFLEGANLTHLESFVSTLRQVGAKIELKDNGVYVDGGCDSLNGVDVMTEPYPGLATDLQAQFMALMCYSIGASMITETIFENRFMHVPELSRMGANINVHGSSALIRGVPELIGAPVMATDLRASVSLVLAGLAAKGETIINRIYHLDRGYEKIEEKFQGCGAVVERLPAA